MIRRFIPLALALGLATPALAATKEHDASDLKAVRFTGINAAARIEFWDRDMVSVEIDGSEWPESVILEENGGILEIGTAGPRSDVKVTVDECKGDDCAERTEGARAIFMHEGAEDPIVLDLDELTGDPDENVWVKKIGDDDGEVTVEKHTDGDRKVIVVRRKGEKDGEDEDGKIVRKVVVVKGEDDEDVMVYRGDEGKQLHRVRVNVDVEKDRNVDEVHSITVRMPRKLDVTARTVNGPLHLGKGAADADVSTVNGKLTVDGHTGDLSASTVAGALVLENTAGDVSARTVSGNLQVHDPSGDVRARSVSGSIEHFGKLAKGTTYQIHTTSGAITFHLPRSADFNYDIDTFSGQVSAKGFKIPQNTGRIVGTVGNADTKSATVEVHTMSGAIRFEKQ